jgi:hypothetical protein
VGLEEDAGMAVHAFVDESGRDRLYVVAVTVATPDQLTPLRRALRGLLLPGEREVHFAHQKRPRKGQLADRIATLNVSARIYTGASPPKTEGATRQLCLSPLVGDLLSLVHGRRSPEG